MISLTRAWINQPSTLQPHHKLHGTNVLALLDGQDNERYVQVWFLSGDTSSQTVDRLALSTGWLKAFDFNHKAAS